MDFIIINNLLSLLASLRALRVLPERKWKARREAGYEAVRCLRVLQDNNYPGTQHLLNTLGDYIMSRDVDTIDRLIGTVEVLVG